VRTEQLRQEFELEIRWTVFPLHPDTPEEGLELEELFAGRIDVPAAMRRMKTVAAELGLPLGDRTRTYNSRNAQELGKWAEQQGVGDLFKTAIYHAYFVEGRNIAKTDELGGIAESIGLSAPQALLALKQKDFAATVDADWARCRELGVTSVPSHIYQNRSLVGFQDYPAFNRLITGVPTI